MIDTASGTGSRWRRPCRLAIRATTAKSWSDRPYPEKVSGRTGSAAWVSSFGVASSWATLRAACRIVGFSDDDASLLRLGENALFHLPKDDVVVRIARTMDYQADVVKEVNVARWLAEQKFPAAEVCDVDQPIFPADHPVTFWRFIHGRPGDRQDIATLGQVLRRLHAMSRPTTFTLPEEDILGRVLPRLEKASISRDDKSFLLDRCNQLQSEVSRLRYPLEPAPTHGDAHNENLMFRDEQPILIDFERFAWGQPEWDLAMTATEHVTAKWWTAEEYRIFADAYGYDVTSWVEGFDVLRAVHELKMTTWLMQNVDESPEIADEYQVRMQTLRGAPSQSWRPF